VSWPLGRTPRRLLVATVLLALAWLWAAGGLDDAQPISTASDADLLEQAQNLRRSLRGAGALRDELRYEVARELVELSRACASPQTCAELLLDAAEVNAASGELALALDQCQRASGLASLARSREMELQTAHLERRLGRLDEACARYLRLTTDSLLKGPDRDAAAYWCARLAEEQGRTRLAQERWLAMARNAFLTRRRVSAYERLMLSLMQTGDSDQARRVLRELETELGPYFHAVTQQGKELRRAYDRTLQRLELKLQAQVQ